MISSTVALVGTLVEDPELRYTATGTPVLTMTVRVTYTNGDPTGNGARAKSVPTRVVCWRETAEHVAASLRKGDRVVVAGHLGLNQWTTKDGTERERLEVIADEIGPSLRWVDVEVLEPEPAEPEPAS